MGRLWIRSGFVFRIRRCYFWWRLPDPSARRSGRSCWGQASSSCPAGGLGPQSPPLSGVSSCGPRLSLLVCPPPSGSQLWWGGPSFGEVDPALVRWTTALVRWTQLWWGGQCCLGRYLTIFCTPIFFMFLPHIDLFYMYRSIFCIKFWFHGDICMCKKHTNRNVFYNLRTFVCLSN